jgi:Tol biopolymer transport system component
VRVGASDPRHGRLQAAAGEEGQTLRAGTVRIGLGLGVAVVLAAVAAADAPGRGTTSASPVRTSSTIGLTASRFGKGAAETRPARIVVAKANGSGSRVLTTGWSSYVSPDGSRVAVLDGDVNYTNLRLELYASSGGVPTRTFDIPCGGVVWSPDSTRLACVDYGDDPAKPWRLLLIDPDSGTPTTLATGFFDSQISFSPDSTRLAYVQKTTGRRYLDARARLKVVDLATRKATTIRVGAAVSPAWGPEAIAFGFLKPRGRNYTSNVAFVQPDGSGYRQVTSFRPTAELFGPTPAAWSADGKRLLAGMEGQDAWIQRESYAVDPTHGSVRLIAHGVAPDALSRDGRYVIGATGDAATTGLAGSNVVRVPWGGGAKRVLLRQAVAPSFNG